MPAWTLPPDVVKAPVITEQDRLYGPDIRFRGDTEVGPNGDYVLATGILAVHQSVEREAMASPGDLVAEPEWGMGLRAALKRPQTTTLVDELRTRAETRVAVNPRVSRVREVKLTRTTFDDGKHGLELDLRVEGGGRDSRLPPIRVRGI